jgi:hypothetical protein
MNDKRARFESEEDLAHELVVASFLTQRWNCVAFKLPYIYSLDFVFTRQNKVAAFCEMKNVGYTLDFFTRIGGYKISLHKWNAAKSLCASTDVPFFLVLKTLDDKLWYAKFTEFKTMPTVFFGRKDIRDEQDKEPCVIITTDNFTQF